MSPGRARIKRWLGYAIMVASWGALLCLLFFFTVVYAIYADLKASDRSRLTAGTGAEFVAGAIYDRFRLPTKTLPDAELIYLPHPGEQRAKSPEYDTRITIDTDGTRHQTAAPEASGGLVVIAGDSFALGLGVEDRETYSALLQERFHHRTCNTGVISYGTARELWRLRRMGLLERASKIVIQFCSNDARENHDFLTGFNGTFGRTDAARAWTIVETPYLPEFSYASVLRATVHYVRSRAATEGYFGALKAIAGSRRAALGATARTRDNRSGAELAADFLGVLDKFPELSGKPVYVLELNDRGGSSGFLEALATQAARRPNVKPVPVRFTAEQFFRFDGHLTPRGHETVAAALDRALREP